MTLYWILSVGVLLVLLLVFINPPAIRRKKRTRVISVKEVRLCTLTSFMALDNIRLQLRKRNIPFREQKLEGEAAFRLNELNYSSFAQQPCPPTIIFVPTQSAPKARRLLAASSPTAKAA